MPRAPPVTSATRPAIRSLGNFAWNLLIAHLPPGTPPASSPQTTPRGSVRTPPGASLPRDTTVACRTPRATGPRSGGPRSVALGAPVGRDTVAGRGAVVGGRRPGRSGRGAAGKRAAPPWWAGPRHVAGEGFEPPKAMPADLQ